MLTLALGALLRDHASLQVSIRVGDGTTAATVLAGSIFRESLKDVTVGANPTWLQRGIMQAIKVIVRSGRNRIGQLG